MAITGQLAGATDLDQRADRLLWRRYCYRLYRPGTGGRLRDRLPEGDRADLERRAAARLQGACECTLLEGYRKSAIGVYRQSLPRDAAGDLWPCRCPPRYQWLEDL